MCFCWFTVVGLRIRRDAYVSLKSLGPTYGGTEPQDDVLVDRIIFVQRQDKP